VRIPERVAGLSALSGGQEWLDSLEGIVATCAERWDLDIGDPFEDAFVSWTAPATRGGEDVVLKIQFPHEEAEHEADALRVWDGNGAVRLLDHDPGHSALLLERCTPGAPLSNLGPEPALAVLIDLLPRLWITAGAPFRSVVEEASGWLDRLPGRWESEGRPFDRRLIDAALEALVACVAETEAITLVSQDLHAGNVLSATREPWLLIDPKPLLADREFSLAPIIRSPELGHSKHHALRRLDRLTDEFSLDRERARLWCIGQTVAWSFDEGVVFETHLDVVRWLLDAT
jgi:streptomycin 6-kinase